MYSRVICYIIHTRMLFLFFFLFSVVNKEHFVENVYIDKIVGLLPWNLFLDGTQAQIIS